MENQPPTCQVFADTKCPACVSEMKYLSSKTLLDVQDMAHPNPHTKNLPPTWSKRHLMLHVLDENNQWHVGVDAFIELYRRAGWEILSQWMSVRWIHRLLDVVYPVIVWIKSPLRQKNYSRESNSK